MPWASHFAYVPLGSCSKVVLFYGPTRNPLPARAGTPLSAGAETPKSLHPAVPLTCYAVPRLSRSLNDASISVLLRTVAGTSIHHIRRMRAQILLQDISNNAGDGRELGLRKTPSAESCTVSSVDTIMMKDSTVERKIKRRLVCLAEDDDTEKSLPPGA